MARCGYTVAVAILAFLRLSSPYTILHMADFHLDVNYTIHGDRTKMCHETNTTLNETLGTFGDYLCDAPKPLVEHAIDEAQRIIPNPDLLIWTGDNVPHVEGYGWDYVFHAMNVTSTLLFTRFPNVTIIPTFGNHDYAPANAFTNDSALYEKAWQLWGSYVPAENKETFLKGGYYKLELQNATFLILNTNLYYNANKAYDTFSNKKDPADQFQFLESELLKAEQCTNRVTGGCSRTVNIIAHIAPGVFERSPDYPWFRDQYNERFLNLTIRFADSIGMMLFGHHHTDTFHIVKDENGTPVQTMWMSPSVTPWYSTLPGAGANNPTFRTLRLDQQQNIEDFTSYYVNLDELNKNATTQFKELYSFAETYGVLGDITPLAVSKVLEEMKSNDTVFGKYIEFNNARYNGSMPKGIYRKTQLCSMEWVDFKKVRECVNSSKFTVPIFSMLAVLVNQL